MHTAPPPKATSRSTAELLGAYHRELVAEGIPPRVIDQLVVDAAQALVRPGQCVLTVKPAPE